MHKALCPALRAAAPRFGAHEQAASCRLRRAVPKRPGPRQAGPCSESGLDASRAGRARPRVVPAHSAPPAARRHAAVTPWAGRRPGGSGGSQGGFIVIDQTPARSGGDPHDRRRPAVRIHDLSWLQAPGAYQRGPPPARGRCHRGRCPSTGRRPRHAARARRSSSAGTLPRSKVREIQAVVARQTFPGAEPQIAFGRLGNTRDEVSGR